MVKLVDKLNEDNEDKEEKKNECRLIWEIYIEN